MWRNLCIAPYNLKLTWYIIYYLSGSYQCRVGWSIHDEPYLTFKNLIARPRKDRCKKDAEPPVTPPIQIGNDIINIEAVRYVL